nr:hypothetical protein [Tanacetum cinerariifolium]
MDGLSGYNQRRLAEKDQKKTSFITGRETFCAKVMPFGSAVIFHEMMYRLCGLHSSQIQDKGQLHRSPPISLREASKIKEHGAAFALAYSHVCLDLVEIDEPAETVVRLPKVVEQKIPAYLELIGEELVVATLDCSGWLSCR